MRKHVNPNHSGEVTERRIGSEGLTGTCINVACSLAIGGLISFMPGTTMANQIIGSGGGSPARGHAQVVAQAVIELPSSYVQWRIADGSVDSNGDTLTAVEDGFLVNSGGLLLVTDDSSGAAQRLAYGEAMSIHDGVSYSQISLGDEAATFYLIGIGAKGHGTIFEGGEQELAGVRDLGLMRDSLKPNEKAELSGDDGKIVILATNGELKVLQDGERSVKLRSGEAGEFEHDIKLVASGNGGASYLAAVVGDRLIEELPGVPDTGGDVVADSEVPVDEQTAGPHQEDVSDPDGDGLSNTEENQLGTDRNNPDTDGDGLTDGNELFTYGTDPLNADSDYDTLTDGDEMTLYFSDPINQDSDGDNLMDSEVLLYGTSPNDPDSDHDGWLDLDEIGANGRPLIQDTDQDGILDRDEVHAYGTNPFAADSDGDDSTDLIEINVGTDPIDANSHP
jgi:hypothetical protein